VVDPCPGLSAALRVAYRQDGAISRAQARAVGLGDSYITRLVRAGRWRRAGRGAFLVPGAHPLRGPAAAALLSRPDAVVCGLTAARLLRFEALPQPRRDERVHLLLPRERSRGQPADVVLRWGRVAAEDVVDLRGIPVTAPARTLADLVLVSRREDAVALMDAALRTGQLCDLSPARAAAVGRHGSVERGSWWALADGRAESPLETRLRLLLADGGLPPPTPQCPVVGSDGWTLARLDLAWPAFRVDVEADGREVHAAPTALYRDRERQNLLANLGWTVLRFTWQDILQHPQHVIRVVTTALRAAGWR
jgi:hypothetical protein